jgi:hypothetical protein
MLNPVDLVVSSKGYYVFSYEFNRHDGVVYSVDKDLRLHLLKELRGGCGGGGFTADERYLFTNSDMDYYGAKEPKLNIYHLEGDNVELRSSEIAPTTATLHKKFLVREDDEIVGTAYNALLYCERGGLVYQFDRTSETLSLKQYLPDLVFNWSAMNPSGDMIFYWRSKPLYSMVRDESGLWKAPHDSFWNDDWYSADYTDAVVSLDGRFVYAAVHSFEPEAPYWGGLQVISLDSERKMQPLYFTHRTDLYKLALSPDGRLLAAAYLPDGQRTKIDIFRLGADGIPSLLSTFDYSAYVGCWAFLPQALPPNAAKEWPAYGETHEKVGTAVASARTPAAPRGQ